MGGGNGKRADEIESNALIIGILVSLILNGEEKW